MKIPGIGEIGICPVHILKDNYNLLQNGQFNILDFGADPSGAVSSSTAIQQAVDAAAAWSATELGLGATVKIPAGLYLITAGIQLQSYIHIVCDPGAMFYFPAAYAGTMWTNEPGNKCSFASVYGGVYGQQGGTRTWTFINLESDEGTNHFCMFNRFENMTVFDCYIGINFNVTNDGWINGNTFNKITFWRPIIGSQMRQAATGQGCDANFFTEINIQLLSGTSTYGLDWNCAKAADHNKVVHMSFWDISAAAGDIAISTNCRYSYFDGIMLGILPADINLVIIDTGYWNRIDYRGSWHSPFEYPIRIHGIYADRMTVDKLVIDHAGDPGTSVTPAGDVGIKLKSYQSTAYGLNTANGAVRIITRNQAGSNNGSYLILQTHGTALDDVNYLNSVILKPSGGMRLLLAGCPVYANNAAAIAGGLVQGDLYRTGGDPDSVCIVH